MLKELEGIGKKICVPAKQPVYLAGDNANHLYELISGSALLYTSNPRGKVAVLKKLRPDDLFGFEVFESLEKGYAGYSSSIKTSEPCQVLEIPGCEVSELVRNPLIASAIMRIQLERASLIEAKELMFRSRNSLARLAMILFEFADYEDGQWVVNNLPGEELGEAIWRTREQTNHALNILRKAGLVSNHVPGNNRSSYRILDEEALKNPHSRWNPTTYLS